MEDDEKEIHAWGRHVAQTFVTWYTGFFAFNATGLGLVAAFHKNVTNLSLVCYVFILFNLLGVGSSTVVGLYGKDADRRLSQDGTSKSPFPIGLWYAITTICGVSLVGMAIAWIALLKNL
jgi:hypothetical protein